MILNDLIILSLSMYPIFYDNVIDGDNYQILRNVLAYAEPNSRAMLVELNTTLANYKKKREVSYPAHERGLRDIFEQFKSINRPISDEDKIIHLVSGMADDSRYSRVVEEVNNDSASYSVCNRVFLVQARKVNNVLGSNQNNTNNQINNANTNNNRHDNQNRDRGRDDSDHDDNNRRPRNRNQNNKDRPRNDRSRDRRDDRPRDADRSRDKHNDQNRDNSKSNRKNE